MDTLTFPVYSAGADIGDVFKNLGNSIYNWGSWALFALAAAGLVYGLFKIYQNLFTSRQAEWVKPIALIILSAASAAGGFKVMQMAAKSTSSTIQGVVNGDHGSDDNPLGVTALLPGVAFDSLDAWS